MTLVIEDGTGMPNSDAFSGVSEYKAWHLSVFGEADSASDSAIEAAIRRGVLFLNSLPWNGSKKNGRLQALAWPRISSSDAEGLQIGEDEIPREVIAAQNFLTKQEAASPGSLSPTASPQEAKVLIELEGVKWKPLSNGWSFEEARVKVGPAFDLINGFLLQEEVEGTRAGIWSL